MPTCTSSPSRARTRLSSRRTTRSYGTRRTAKGAKPRIVLDGVVQEIDIPTGLVLFQWDSLDHVPVSASYQPIPANTGHPWDYFHLNSAQLIGNGNVIISSRDTWAVYDVSHQTGRDRVDAGRQVLELQDGSQHVVRLPARRAAALRQPHDHLRRRRRPARRAQAVARADAAPRHDAHDGVAGRRRRRIPPRSFRATRAPTSCCATAICWSASALSRGSRSSTPTGKTVFDARFVDANQSYRAYRYAWTGTPASPPSIGTRTSKGKTTVYASWNGSTQLARWQVLGGSSPSKMSVIASAGKAAFETPIKLRSGRPYLEVRALDAHGKVLGTSSAVKP